MELSLFHRLLKSVRRAHPRHTETGLTQVRQTTTKVTAKPKPAPTGRSTAKEIITTAKGNKQYIYDEEHHQRAKEEKTARVKSLAKSLPDLLDEIKWDLSQDDHPKTKVVSAIVALIDRCYFRIGTGEYAEKHGTYGISTLRPEHVTVNGNAVRFQFVGKKQVEWDKTITDPELAKFIKSLKDTAKDGQLFWYHVRNDNNEVVATKPIRASDVNEKLSSHNVTAKDFRTYHATRLCYEGLKAVSRKKSEPELSQAEMKRRMKAVIESVAEHLGHTPSVCKTSYILPQLIDNYVRNGGRVETAPWRS